MEVQQSDGYRHDPGEILDSRGLDGTAGLACQAAQPSKHTAHLIIPLRAAVRYRSCVITAPSASPEARGQQVSLSRRTIWRQMGGGFLKRANFGPGLVGPTSRVAFDPIAQCQPPD
jgi:hypothetical protein